MEKVFSCAARTVFVGKCNECSLKGWMATHSRNMITFLDPFTIHKRDNNSCVVHTVENHHHPVQLIVMLSRKKCLHILLCVTCTLSVWFPTPLIRLN